MYVIFVYEFNFEKKNVEELTMEEEWIKNLFIN